MYSLPIPSSPERLAIARQLLHVLAIFGAVVATIDFLKGNHLGAAGSALISAAILVVLYLARRRVSAALPLQFAIWLLLCMYIFGTITQMPMHQEKAVWSTVFPFAFFYLAGLQTGLWLTVFSFVFTIATYQLYVWTGSAIQITFYGFTQTIAAFFLCSIFAYLYEKVRTRQEGLLRQSAQCDSLTGLLNRRGFETVSCSTLQQTMRSDDPCAVLLIDLDNFKEVNDTQGHDAGDLLLKEFSTLLRSQTRSADIISRWGGEEFLLLLQTDLEGARQLGEKIRSAMASYPFSSGTRTASIGVAVHEQQEALEETLKRADLAMYQAKKKGKNRVEVLTG